MTHLRIQQSDSAIEQVSSAVITKLYELATSGELDNTSDLVGRLNVTATYQDYIDGIRAEYPGLYISADKLYVKFNDPAFQRACAQLYGDGVGMTMADFQAVTDESPYYAFNGNTEITDMTEFKYFTNTPSVLDSNGHHWLFDIQNLRNIEFPNHVTKIAWTTAEDPYDNNTFHYYRMFYRTTSLQYVKFPNSITSLNIANSPSILDLRNTSLQSFEFEGNGAVEVYLPSTLIYLDCRAFVGSSGIKKVVVPETNGSFEIRPTSGYQTMFFGNSGVTLDLPSTTTQIVYAMFNNNTTDIFILRATTPPSVVDADGNASTSINNAGSIDLYVPDGSTSTYQSNTAYSSFKHIYGLSQLPASYSQVPAS